MRILINFSVCYVRVCESEGLRGGPARCVCVCVRVCVLAFLVTYMHVCVLNKGPGSVRGSMYVCVYLTHPRMKKMCETLICVTIHTASLDQT